MQETEKRHFSNVKYHRIQRTDDGFHSIFSFRRPLTRIPKKAIALATFLFVMGSTLIVMSSFILHGLH
uniref:Uncharacterized protein n=1 Tax=Ixodes ricinus TaxID=34613 RepID=V5IGD5_IXORI